MGREGFLGLGNVGAHVNIVDVHEDPGSPPGAFALDHVGALVHVNVGHLFHGDLGPGGSGDEHPAQGRQILPVILEVAQIHRVALQTLHGLGDIFAAQGAGNDLLDITHGQPVAGRLPALDDKVEIIAAGDPFGKGAGGAGHVLQDGFGLHRQPVQNFQVRSQEFNAHRGLDAGGEHVDADLDGIAPGVGQPREFDRGVHLLDEALRGQARTPVFPVFQPDGGLDHAQGRRVGGGVGPAGLAEDVLHLGKGANDAVRLLKDVFRLGDGDARHGGGHIQQVALIQGRHELGPQVHQGIDGDRHGQEGRQDGGLGKAHDDPQHRPVHHHGGPGHGILLIRDDLAPDEIEHENGNQGDGQDGGPAHGKGLGEGQGPEQAARFPGQGEDGQKGDR